MSLTPKREAFAQAVASGMTQTRNRYSHLYGTYKWKQVRTRHLQRNPLCAMCEQDGRITLATVCDHITPHKGNETMFYQGPFQSLCKTHHDGAKARQESRGIIVGGDVDGMPIDPAHHWNK